MEQEQPIKILYGLWYAIFIIGMNSAEFLAASDKMIYIFLLFMLIEFLAPKKGFIINIFFALLIVQVAFYPGKFYTFYWINWLIRDINRELTLMSSGDYLPIISLCINLAVIILMQGIYTRTFLGRWPNTLFFCLGTAMLAIVYTEQVKGSAVYIILFVTLGLLVKIVDLRESSAPYPTGILLRNCLPLVIVFILFSFVLPDYDRFDVGDWFRKEIIYRPSFFNYSNKVGYNAYDGDLGGKLIEDNTPVLLLQSPIPVYLKGETKSYYTGRGWETGFKYAVNSSAMEASYIPSEKEINVHFQVLSPSKILYVPRYPSRISLLKGYHILYPSGFDIDSNYLHEYFTYRANLGTGDEYDIVINPPSDDPDILRGLTNEKADLCYTSLDNIPEKVRKLALIVTEKHNNGYDKAAALAGYLRYGKWEYSTDTPVPLIGKNFVEHFLFESDSGYCVHFSTAFVLMARSVGLPARWVKGYNFGTPEDNNTYSISNNNAHTWGEVWFDDYGWVPFEPTPDNPYLNRAIRDGYRELIEPEGRWGRGIYGYDDTNMQAPMTHRSFVVFSYLFIVAILAIVYLVCRYIWYDINMDIEKQYTMLQGRLKLFGWDRYPWETPREHWQRMNILPERKILYNFVQRFEGIIYGEENNNKRIKLGSSYSFIGLVKHYFISSKKNNRKGS